MGFKSILLAIPFDKRFKVVVSAIKRYVLRCVITARLCYFLERSRVDRNIRPVFVPMI